MQERIYATVAYPLRSVTLPRGDSGWAPGAYRPEQAAIHYGDDARLRFYANTQPLGNLLRTERRAHLRVDAVEEHVLVVAAELITTPSEWSAVAGYLVVHVETTQEAPEISALAQIGQIVRPATEPARRVLSVVGEQDDGAASWVLAASPRVPSLCLSGVPGDESAGLVRWDESSPRERRLADLVTMPRYGRDVPLPFDLRSRRPTPSYLVAGSGSAVAVLRLRDVRDDHVHELRTHWFDAMLVELTQRDTAIALVERVRDLVPSAGGSQWRDFERRFRSWRTQWAWQASTDHPLESGLAEVVREELGTDELVARVESEVADHARAAALRADENLNRVAIVLSVLALVLAAAQLLG